MTSLTYIAILVLLAYGVFFAYDVVSVRRPQASRSYLLFAAGFLLNTAAAIVFFASNLPGCVWDALSIASLACAAACFALMIWALFFALPKDTYADPKQGRPVFDKGMYAICRHPGVLWYCGVFLFAALAFRTPQAAASAAVLCAGNIVYMVFQDLWSFPRTFSNYAQYRSAVPFFLPTPASLARALGGGRP